MIENKIGEYKLALITQDFLYYINENEVDENNCVIIKDKNRNLISDNYFAYADYLDHLENIIEGLATYEYVNEEVLKQAREYL